MSTHFCALSVKFARREIPLSGPGAGAYMPGFWRVIFPRPNFGPRNGRDRSLRPA